jgi:hypothetical protein
MRLHGSVGAGGLRDDTRGANGATRLAEARPEDSSA